MYQKPQNIAAYYECWTDKTYALLKKKGISALFLLLHTCIFFILVANGLSVTASTLLSLLIFFWFWGRISTLSRPLCVFVRCT